MIDLLVWAFWFILGAYTFWFFTQAKTFQPFTLDDLALTWRLHKQHRNCRASRINSLLTKNNEVVGFKCDCGYEYRQKRLITQKIPMLKRGQEETRGSPRNLGIEYSRMKEV